MKHNFNYYWAKLKSFTIQIIPFKIGFRKYPICPKCHYEYQKDAGCSCGFLI